MLDDAERHWPEEAQVGFCFSHERFVRKNGRFFVLTPGVAVSMRTIDRLSEDKKRDTEFMNHVKGAHGISRLVSEMQLARQRFQKYSTQERQLSHDTSCQSEENVHPPSGRR